MNVEEMHMQLVGVTEGDPEKKVNRRQMMGCGCLVERKRRRQRPFESFKRLRDETGTHRLSFKGLMCQKFNKAKHLCTHNPSA